ncbi:MAG: hypothetical protein HC880_12275 [Bacteroidia bacterium]|nr:hypothetical protein [Bacteroidia bacterium]
MNQPLPMRWIYLWILSLCFNLATAPSVRADRVTNAYKQIQKGEFDKAKEQLDKQLEKDSLSAGAFHIYAVYYFSENNPAYDIDSAYAFVRKAIDYYPQVNEKDLADWAKDDISLDAAYKLKSAVEVKAFSNATQENTVASFQAFLDKFPGAEDSKLAVAYRNKIAWEEAQSLNTLESYQYFINRFPQAEQIPDAIKRRDRFVYNAETQGGRLSDYRQFARNFPDNSYLSEAIEQIYVLRSVDHSIKNYHDFAQEYPKSEATKKAWDWLLALYQAEHGINNFIIQYPGYYQPDYLEKISQVDRLQYVPVYEQELLWFYG